jgi:hypothetical protein
MMQDPRPSSDEGGGHVRDGNGRLGHRGQERPRVPAVLIGLRLAGKRELGQTTVFDLLVILLIA